MNEEAFEAMAEEGSKYVEEYLRLARNRHVDLESIREIIDIYHDYLLLANVFGVKDNG